MGWGERGLALLHPFTKHGDKSDPDYAALYHPGFSHRAFEHIYNNPNGRPPANRHVGEQWERLVTVRHKMEGLTPRQAKALNALLARHLAAHDVYIRVHGDTLEEILDDGQFESQHESGISNGAYNPRGRRALELTMHGTDVKRGDPGTIYGYASPERFGGLEKQTGAPAGSLLAVLTGSDDMLAQYGDIAVKLKSAKRPDTTITLGDTLDDSGIMLVGNTGMMDPETGLIDAMTFAVTMVSFGPTPLTDPTHVAMPSHWVANADDVLQAEKDGQLTLTPQSSYIEAQIHGGVSVGDIEKVIFTEESDRDYLQQILQDHNIPYEVMTTPQFEWDEEAEDWVGEGKPEVAYSWTPDPAEQQGVDAARATRHAQWEADRQEVVLFAEQELAVQTAAYERHEIDFKAYQRAIRDYEETINAWDAEHHEPLEPVAKHGHKGDPGYYLLHPGRHPRHHLGSSLLTNDQREFTHLDWQPTMTRPEAQAWAADSVIRTPVTYVGRRSSIAQIKQHGFRDPLDPEHKPSSGSVWGRGLYFGMAEEEVRHDAWDIPQQRIIEAWDRARTEALKPALQQREDRILEATRRYNTGEIDSYTFSREEDKAYARYQLAVNAYDDEHPEPVSESIIDPSIQMYAEYKDETGRVNYDAYDEALSAWGQRRETYRDTLIDDPDLDDFDRDFKMELWERSNPRPQMDDFTPQSAPAQAVLVQVNVHNPVRINVPPGSGFDLDFLLTQAVGPHYTDAYRQTMAEMRAEAGDPTAFIDTNAVHTRTLKKLGYDSIIVTEYPQSSTEQGQGFSYGVGGPQVVVFDPHNVVIIEGESPRYMKPIYKHGHKDDPDYALLYHPGPGYAKTADWFAGLDWDAFDEEKRADNQQWLRMRADEIQHSRSEPSDVYADSQYRQARGVIIRAAAMARRSAVTPSLPPPGSGQRDKDWPVDPNPRNVRDHLWTHGGSHTEWTFDPERLGGGNYGTGLYAVEGSTSEYGEVAHTFRFAPDAIVVYINPGKATWDDDVNAAMLWAMQNADKFPDLQPEAIVGMIDAVLMPQHGMAGDQPLWVIVRNPDAIEFVDSVDKHLGPGPHPTGTPQSVHGLRGTLRALTHRGRAGGFTFRPSTHTYPHHGYPVAVDNALSAHVPMDEWDGAHLEAFVTRYQDRFADDPTLHLGGWYNDERDEMVLDLVELFTDRDAAIVAGQQRDQEAIWDLERGVAIDTGGSGGVEKASRGGGAQELEDDDRRGAALLGGPGRREDEEGPGDRRGQALLKHGSKGEPGYFLLHPRNRHHELNVPTGGSLAHTHAQQWMAERGLTQDVVYATTVAVLDRADPATVEAGKHWYENAYLTAEELHATYPHTTIEQAAGVLAAVSPRNGWRTPDDPLYDTSGNVHTAHEVLDAVHHPRPIHITQAAVDRARKNYKVDLSDRLGQWVDSDRLTPAEQASVDPRVTAGLPDGLVKAFRIARGEQPNDILGGSKVRSFYNDIMDYKTTDSVAIDSHQARAMTGRVDLPDKVYDEIARNPARYDYFADIVRQIAAERHLRPHVVQAIIWLQWRNEHSMLERRAVNPSNISSAQDVTLGEVLYPAPTVAKTPKKKRQGRGEMR